MEKLPETNINSNDSKNDTGPNYKFIVKRINCAENDDINQITLNQFYIKEGCVKNKLFLKKGENIEKIVLMENFPKKNEISIEENKNEKKSVIENQIIPNKLKTIKNFMF